MDSLPPRVLLFAVPRGDGNVDAVATDEGGEFLSAKVCSGEGWARRDLLTPFHRWFYARRHPDGYLTDWVGTPPPGWDGQRAHTDGSVKPWHLDPANGSTLYPEELDRKTAGEDHRPP